jgi:hypothetical protein
MCANQRMRATLWALVGALAAALVPGITPVVAQTVTTPTPAQQTELEQVALAGARTELCERVGTLPLSLDRTLADWLRTDVDLDRALRLWVRTRPRQGNARLYSDALCEADVRIEPAELLEQLLTLLGDYPASATATGLDAGKLKAAAHNWPILWATGRAALSKTLRSGQPPGWEDVTAEGVELARGAATADAYHALLTAAGRLKVTSARRLHEFLDSSPAIRDAVQAELQRTAKVKVEFAPDQTAVVEVRVTMRDLLRILTRAHQELYHGDEFEAADFRQMALLAGQEDLTSTGLATPPAAARLRSHYEPIEYDLPDWAATTLTAIGRYTPPDGETPDPAAQRDAARLDGVDQLSKQIGLLVIRNGVTISEYLAYHQDLKDDVTLLLSGARLVAQSPAQPDGGASVKVELPLRRLWEILRRSMKLEEVEPPPTTAATTTAPSNPPEREKP